jgi:hypothetical protein
MKKILFPITIILIAALFTSCVTVLSTDSTITIDEKENWQVEYEILFEGFSFKEYGQQITDGINMLTEQYKSNGITLKFKQLPVKNGNIPYQIAITGQGLDALNTTLGTTPEAFSKTTENGETLYKFSMDGSTMSSGELSLGTAMEFSFTIKGMRIVESNGKKTSPTSVTWTDASQTMTATLKPGGPAGGGFKWWIIPIVLFGLAVITMVVLMATGVFKKKPKPGYGVPPGYMPQYYPPVPSSGGPPSVPQPAPGVIPQTPPPTVPPTSTTPPPPPPAGPAIPPPRPMKK